MPSSPENIKLPIELKNTQKKVLMNASRSVLTVCAVAGLIGCAAPPQRVFSPPVDYVPIGDVKIESKFKVIKLERENLAAEINRCVPQISATSPGVVRALSEFPSRSTSVSVHGHVSSANAFWASGTTGICLQSSSEGFPIFAAEAFLNTVNPSGVPPDVTDAWYKQIALLVATKGTAKVAYVFDKGTAFVADYWVQQPNTRMLNYSVAFRKVGEWESQVFDVRFSHPGMSSVAETKRGGSAIKSNLLAHRNL